MKSPIPTGMPSIDARLRGHVTVIGFRLGWRLVRALPERAAYALFDRIADLCARRGWTRLLRENYATVCPDLDEAELNSLTREGMRAYLRYYCEAFRLPDWDQGDLNTRVRFIDRGGLKEEISAGGLGVCFLGHLGNWDLAGAWGAVNLGQVTTVAERLKPEAVFDEFLRFRTGLGMRILPLTGGPPAFPQLQLAAREPGLIPLLADRDLTRHGVEVSLCGRPARMAGGPAVLALTRKRPLFPVTIHHERLRAPGARWGIVVVVHERIDVPATGTTSEKVQVMTQRCAEVLGRAIQDRPADWHMLQPVFTKDLDAARLGRAGFRAS